MAHLLKGWEEAWGTISGVQYAFKEPSKSCVDKFTPEGHASGYFLMPYELTEKEVYSADNRKGTSGTPLSNLSKVIEKQGQPAKTEGPKL